MSDKYAVLVGINKFPNVQGSDLQGCVNDALDMKDLLISKFGYSDSNIVVLLDKEATKKSIMNALSSMVNKAKIGIASEIRYLHSSHGTQVKDLNGDEFDEMDEALCCSDLSHGDISWNNVIVDDELKTLFTGLPNNILLECWFDTCHSGTALKSMPTEKYFKEKFIKPISYTNKHAPKKRKSKCIFGSAIARNILWAACKSDQTSADAFINGRYNGAFTRCYIESVSSGIARRNDILVDVKKRLKAGGFQQTPQLEINSI